jgi:hypothetical protein
MEAEIAHIRFMRDTIIERAVDSLLNTKPAFVDISAFEKKVSNH